MLPGLVGAELVALVLLASFAGGASRVASASERSSITPPRGVVVVLADDLGYGDLSCYRAGATATPACDRLAREGLRLTDAHSASSVCSPTRYSVLTGRYAWRSYLKNWVLAESMPAMIDEATPTLPRVLGQRGVRTATIGKWHLGWGRTNEAFFRGEYDGGPSLVGFEEFFVVPHSHNSREAMQVFVEGLPGQQPRLVPPTPRSLEDTATNLTGQAVAFLEDSANEERPFFLYYATTNVHFPITPHERFVEAGDDVPPLPENANRLQQRTRERALYPGFVREFDWCVGQVLETLDRTGLADETLMIVTSDNGGAQQFGGHNGALRGNKGQLYEGGHRVPWIIRGPGVRRGTSDQLTCTTDLLPTIAAAMQCELPETAAPLDGCNLWPVWTGAEPASERPAVVHHSVAGMFAVRRGRWKLIEGLGTGQARFTSGLYDPMPTVTFDEQGTPQPFTFPHEPFPQPEPGQPRVQLFDLMSDPGEEHDLAGSRPGIVSQLQAELAAIREP